MVGCAIDIWTNRLRIAGDRKIVLCNNREEKGEFRESSRLLLTSRWRLLLMEDYLLLLFVCSNSITIQFPRLRISAKIDNSSVFHSQIISKYHENIYVFITDDKFGSINSLTISQQNRHKKFNLSWYNVSFIVTFIYLSCYL